MAYTVARDYTWGLKIASYDAGKDRRLRPSNQLKLQQEVGELHLGEGGLTWEEFYRHGMIFVLTRLNSVIHRAPVLDEKVWLRTWHRDTKGAQFYRCYQFLDAAGNPLIESVSAFALVDPVTHKLLRPEVFQPFGVETQPGPGQRLPRSRPPAPTRGACPGGHPAGVLVGHGLQRPPEQHRLRGYPVRFPARRHGGQAAYRLFHLLPQGGHGGGGSGGQRLRRARRGLGRRRPSAGNLL